jgi:hypothetical protein
MKNVRCIWTWNEQMFDWNGVLSETPAIMIKRMDNYFESDN